MIQKGDKQLDAECRLKSSVNYAVEKLFNLWIAMSSFVFSLHFLSCYLIYPLTP